MLCPHALRHSVSSPRGRSARGPTFWNVTGFAKNDHNTWRWVACAGWTSSDVHAFLCSRWRMLVGSFGKESEIGDSSERRRRSWMRWSEHAADGEAPAAKGRTRCAFHQNWASALAGPLRVLPCRGSPPPDSLQALLIFSSPALSSTPPPPRAASVSAPCPSSSLFDLSAIHSFF